MFPDTDERLFLLHQEMNPLTQRSLNRFAEVGVRTVYLNFWASWDNIEPSPGVYNWDRVDRAIGMNREAGLKTVVQLYAWAPRWLSGIIERVSWDAPYVAVDPEMPDALATEAEFLERACAHYTALDVSCCYGVTGAGERVLPIDYGRPYTMQQCIDLVLRRQRIFAKHSDELWGSWHPGPALGYTSVDGHTKEKVGNEYIHEIFEAMKEEFPKHTINRLVYTYFWGGAPQWPPDPPWVKMWVGAEYCINVPGSAERIQPCGAWGLLVAHSDAMKDRRQPHDWEFDNTAKALEILREYHERAI